MLLQDILDIKEEIYLVEPSYNSQKTLVGTISYLKDILDVIDNYSLNVIQIIDGTKTTGLAIFNEKTEEVPMDFWSIFTSSIASQSNEEFSSIADSILESNLPQRVVEVSDSAMHEALIEYYSILLVNRETCNECTMPLESYGQVYTDDRVKRLSVLLDEVFEKLSQSGISIGDDVLEICCGNGMSTIALHKLGIEPTTIEYEKCTLCQGLAHGVLDPKKTIVMDATMLSNFFEPRRFDCVFGFMLGTIYEFNKDMWARMMLESAKVAKDGALMLFTVNGKSEMDILESALRMVGIEGEVMDNTDQLGMYDQWVFVGRKV